MILNAVSAWTGEPKFTLNQLLRALTEATPDWTVWKNVDSALAKIEALPVVAGKVTVKGKLLVGKKLKAKGRPIGQTLGHTFGDSPTFSYPFLWSFGGKEFDEQLVLCKMTVASLQSVVGREA